MKILENDIASIEPFGMLDGRPVNLVATKGGLQMATHTDSKGNESVIGAASHRAILCYTLEQRFSNFQPMIMKSEKGIRLNADSHSHFLTDDLRKSGHDIFSVQNGQYLDFYATKLNVELGRISAHIGPDKILLVMGTVPKEFKDGVIAAISEKALCSGVKNVKWA